MSIKKELADKLTEVAVKQLEVGIKFKKPRMDEIQKSIDLYNNKTQPALKGRKNIPLPVMSGFVDTLRSDIDDPIEIDFKATEDSDKRKAKRVKAAYDFDSSPTQGDWDSHDLDQKTLAIFSGRAIAKVYSESDPKYKANNETIDYIDFVCEPKGGAYLENHLFHGQMNIMRTESDLKNKVYNQEQISKLISRTSDDNYKKNDNIYREKAERFQSLGLDADTNEYVGQRLYNLTEWIMNWEGDLYYLVFDYLTGTWIRAKLLGDIFKLNKTPFISWATHRDPFNFWNKAPVDDIRPVSKAIHDLFNQTVEAREKGIWGQRGFDPKVIKSPNQLQFRPDGLVQMDVPPGKSISDGIYEFRSPSGEAGGIINLLGFIDSFVGQKTGVTPGSQGLSEADKKVGIYYGDLQRVANRLGLLNKSYKKFQAEMGERYVWGLKEHMPPKRMVRILGERGIEDSELTRKDLDPEFDITPSSSKAAAEMDEIKRKSQMEGLLFIAKSPSLSSKISQSWTVEQILKRSGYDEEDIRIGMDIQSEGNEESITEAAEENQMLYADEKVAPNRKATTAHLQKHLVFSDTILNEINALEKGEKKGKLELKHNAIMLHMRAEIPIAAMNMARQARMVAIMAGGAQIRGGIRPPQIAGEATPTATPTESIVETPPTVAGTARRSQQISRSLTP